MNNDTELKGKNPSIQDRLIGDILLGFSQVTDAHIKKALTTQKFLRDTKNHHLKLGEIMVFQKVISSTQLFAALREQVAKAQQSRLDTIEKAKAAAHVEAAVAPAAPQPALETFEPSPRASRSEELRTPTKLSIQNRMYRLNGITPSRRK